MAYSVNITELLLYGDNIPSSVRNNWFVVTFFIEFITFVGSLVVGEHSYLIFRTHRLANISPIYIEHNLWLNYIYLVMQAGIKKTCRAFVVWFLTYDVTNGRNAIVDLDIYEWCSIAYYLVIACYAIGRMWRYPDDPIVIGVYVGELWNEEDFTPFRPIVNGVRMDWITDRQGRIYRTNDLNYIYNRFYDFT